VLISLERALSNLGLTLWQRWTIGAVLGGILVYCLADHFYHVKTGVLIYHWQPLVDGQSIWVWPIFILAAFFMVLIAYPFTNGCSAPSLKSIIFNFLWTHVIYFSSGIFGNAYLTGFTIVMIILWLFRLTFIHEYRIRIIILSITLSLITGSLEGLFSYFGLFDYQVQQVFRVPFWLFAAYLHAGFFVFSATRWIRTGKFSS